jgi:eukaryotic-like serine/threonine-protein kinase
MEVGDPQVVVQQARARVGSVLRDKWRLDRVIGVGGMATVYAATHRTGSRAAIKMLHASHAWDAEIKRRFLREGYVANTVAHPGAVRVIDDDVTEDGTVFIVMDLLEGETLDGRCKRLGGSLPPEDVLPLIDQLLDILVAAHNKQIVHRDIKPENIFVTHEGFVKLLDFGVARLRSQNPGSVATLLGTMFGTPAFMAPEQALGRTEQIDAQSDIWGVGAVMFSLLAGRLVHVTQTLTEQLVAHASRPAPSLASLTPDMPPSIVAIVDRALAFEKSMRWADAQAMHQAVRDAQIALGWPVPPAMPSASGAAISFPLPSARGRLVSAPPSTERGAVSVPSSGVQSSGEHPPVGTPSIAVRGALSFDEAGLIRRTGLRHPMIVGLAVIIVVITVAILALGRRGEHDGPTLAMSAEPSTPVQAGTTVVSPALSGDPVPSVSASGTPSNAPDDAASGREPGSTPTSKSKAAPRSSKARPDASATTKPTSSAPGDWLEKQH